MSAVSGTRRAIKELADGTIRVQVDIDPRFRKAFFELFPDIDSPVALAPLAGNFEQEKPQEPVEAANDAPPKGGSLAKLSGILCSDPKFQEWIATLNRGLANSAMAVATEGTADEITATIVRAACGVKSRAELDHNPEAAKKFHDYFRIPFNRYCQGEAGNCA